MVLDLIKFQHTHTLLLISLALVVTGSDLYQNISPVPPMPRPDSWLQGLRCQAGAAGSGLLVMSGRHGFATWFQWRAVNRRAMWLLALEQHHRVDC